MDWDQSKYLPSTCYPITQLEAAQVLEQAWVSLFGYKPSINSLAVLFAQFGLETGYGKFSHAWNWGNVKSAPNDGYCWTDFKCNEIIGGKEVWFEPPSPYCRFRAFKTALDGAINYVAFVSQKTRYAKAWQEVINGNPEAYAVELKLAGYFTADLALYTKGVVSICNAFKTKFANVDLSTHVVPADDKPIETFTPEELAHIQSLVGVDLTNSANDYFASSRTAEGSDIDYSSPGDDQPLVAPPSLFDKIKGMFK